MKKTCKTCAHYIDTLSSSGTFHIHDFCALWFNRIPAVHWENDEDSKACIFDDIEKEIAVCWRWEEKITPCNNCEKNGTYNTDCQFCNEENGWRLFK